jgi:hypothetical protein
VFQWFLKFVEKTAPIAVYTTGKRSSVAGLTTSVTFIQCAENEAASSETERVRVISFSVMVQFEGQSDPLEVKFFFNFLYSLFAVHPFFLK